MLVMETISCITIFKKFVCKNILNLNTLNFLNRSMNTLVYSAMTFNAIHMSGSHFKNFFLLAVIEVPSGFMGGYFADTLGRRWTQVLAFSLCGLSCLATSVVVHQQELEILLATFSKYWMHCYVHFKIILNLKKGVGLVIVVSLAIPDSQSQCLSLWCIYKPRNSFPQSSALPVLELRPPSGTSWALLLQLLPNW